MQFILLYHTNYANEALKKYLTKNNEKFELYDDSNLRMVYL